MTHGAPARARGLTTSVATPLLCAACIVAAYPSIALAQGADTGSSPLKVMVPSPDTDVAAAASSSAGETVEELETALDSRERELADLRLELQTLRELERLRAEVDRLKGTVDARTEALADVQGELGELRQALSAAPAPTAVPAGDQPLAEVHFETASAELTPGGRQRALEAAQALAGMEIEAVRIVGHTDRVGDAEHNAALSSARAAAVAAVLSEAGVDAALIDVVGMGESDPPIATADSVAEPLNRCVGIVPVPAEVVATN